MDTKTYTASRLRKLLTVALALPLGILCLAGLYFEFVYDYGTEPLQPSLVLRLVLGLLLIWMVWLIAAVLKRHLVLTAQELQIHGVLSTKVVRRSDLRQYRNIAFAEILVLEVQGPGTDAIRKINVRLKRYKVDAAAFDDWLAGVQNSDEVEYQQSLDEIESDARLGNSVEERRDQLDRACVLARYIQYTSIAITLWALLWPSPYWLVLALLLVQPWIGLCIQMSRPGWFTLSDIASANAKAHLGALLVMPAAALAMRAVSDVQLMDISDLLLPALVVFLLLMACCVWADPVFRTKRITLVGLTMVMAFYSAGGIALLNRLLDREQPAVYRVTVIAGTSTTRTVSAWGRDQTEEELSLPHRLKETTRVGDALCVYQFPGAFGLGWYEVEATQDC